MNIFLILRQYFLSYLILKLYTELNNSVEYQQTDITHCRTTLLELNKALSEAVLLYDIE